MMCLGDLIEYADYDKTNDDLENLIDLADELVGQHWYKDVESVIYEIANNNVDVYNYDLYKSVSHICDTVEEVICESGLIGDGLWSTIQVAQAQVNERVLFDNLTPLLHNYIKKQCLSEYYVDDKDVDVIMMYLDYNLDDFIDDYNISDRFDSITDDFNDFLADAADELGIELKSKEDIEKDRLNKDYVCDRR